MFFKKTNCSFEKEPLVYEVFAGDLFIESINKGAMTVHKVNDD